MTAATALALARGLDSARFFFSSDFFGAGERDRCLVALALFGGLPGPRLTVGGAGADDARFLVGAIDVVVSGRGFFLGLPRFFTGGEMEGSETTTTAAAAEGDLFFGGLPLLRGGPEYASGRGCFLGLPGPRLTEGGSAAAGDLAFPVDFFALVAFFTLAVTGFLPADFGVDAFSPLPLDCLLPTLAFACFAASTHDGQNQL